MSRIDSEYRDEIIYQEIFGNEETDPNAIEHLQTIGGVSNIADPWTGKIKNPVRGTSAVDLTGYDYLKATQPSNIMPENLVGGPEPAKRDALIEAIIDMDKNTIEMVKRLILEKRRLDVLMRLLGYQVLPHQMLLYQFRKGRKYSLILAPRGSGKSTALNICYNVMESLIDRDLCTVIASRTTAQAQSFLTEIKANLEKEALTNIFGELKGKKWDETQADIAGRTRITKEHSFMIAGADGAVVSKHVRNIVADDLVEEKNSRTEGQREVLQRFFYKSLLPTLIPGGSVTVLGTRYHPLDLYGHLKDNDPNYKKSHFVLPAIFDRNTGEAVDLIQRENGEFAAPENAVCWDATNFPMSELISRRSSMSLIDFECQYQNRTEFMAGDFFKYDWFKHYDEDPIALRDRLGLVTWMGVDLAASQKDSADEFAIVVIGVLPSIFEIYALYAHAARLTFKQQQQLLVDVYDTFDPVRTFVEANAYQAVLSTTTIEEFPDIRIVPIYTTTDKVTRAKSLQIYYERGQVYHRKGRMAKLEGQLTGFPDYKLKDLVDALGFAVLGALRGAARKRRTKEPGLF